MNRFASLATTVAFAGALARLPAPASADGTAAAGAVFGTAAIVGGITAANVAKKRRLARTVEGYLPNGATVFADQRVVEPDGQAWYPEDKGQRVGCEGKNCVLTSVDDQNATAVGYRGKRRHGQAKRVYYGYVKRR